MSLAAFEGRDVPAGRVGEVLELWSTPVPGAWMRGSDARVLDPKSRYTRTHEAEIKGPEHLIEHELLDPLRAQAAATVFGESLLDGVNAVPLAKDEQGGRAGNVEADLLLRTASGYYLAEVKSASNYAWYASVELLRQIKLLLESDAARRIMSVRAGTPTNYLYGMVLAPSTFYSANGRRADSVEPSRQLARKVREAFDVHFRLAVWNPSARAVVTLP